MRLEKVLPVSMWNSGNDETGWECGVDEAGRGCVAGPVVCSAVILHPDSQQILLQDSKKLSEKQREAAYSWIIENAVAYSIAFVSQEVIDRINILQATFLGMNTAIHNLGKKLNHIIIDGNRFQLNTLINSDLISVPYDLVIKGDSNYGNIAASSILAKVSRDRYMSNVADKYPQYGFEKHKGYLTADHKEAVKKHGLCDLHRKTFDIII